MLYSYKGNYPELLPYNITLLDGSIKSNPATFTDQDILNAGYVVVPDPPISVDSGYELYWRNNQWTLIKEYELPDIPELPPL
jgi:hypothetical protein